jgi:predicted transcriptional regulator
MMAAEGKQLESLINLASEIGDVTREAFVRELESHANTGGELVQKLVCTLNSKKILPNPEYPRMRRVILKIMISILESCRRTVEMLMEEGMMEKLMDSLTKIGRSPSRVEEYKVFYGNIGVVLEDGEPMSTLLARAKVLLVQHTTQTAGAPIGDHL